MANIGSVLGAGLIVCGLYTVLWGKGREMKTLNKLMPSTESSKELSNHAHSFEIVISSPMINNNVPNKDGGSISGISADDSISKGTRMPSVDDKVYRESPEKKDRTVLTEEERDKAEEFREDV